MDVSLTFIGAGNANSQDLGNACARLLIDGKELLIDFGFTAYNQYKSEFKGVPEAIFITHTHLDHIGGLQTLFFDAYLSKKKVTLFVPVPLISSIHRILASEERESVSHCNISIPVMIVVRVNFTLHFLMRINKRLELFRRQHEISKDGQCEDANPRAGFHKGITHRLHLYRIRHGQARLNLLPYYPSAIPTLR